jgi:hypothetical protein
MTDFDSPEMADSRKAAVLEVDVLTNVESRGGDDPLGTRTRSPTSRSSTWRLLTGLEASRSGSSRSRP